MISASIEVPQNLEAALRGLKPDVMISAVRRGMTRAGQLVAGQIIRTRLTGKGPFPIAAHQLGVRSGRLRKSVRSTPAEVSGSDVTVQIGSAVRYAAAHEFGFTGPVKVKAHSRTVKKAFGVQLKSPVTGTVKAHQRKVTIPERAPIRTGIKESLATFSTEITREVKAAFGN